MYPATVNKIKEFKDRDGGYYLIIVCNEGVVLICKDTETSANGEQFENIGHITDVEGTNNPSQFMLSTQEGLRVATISSSTASLNKEEIYCSGKRVFAAM